MINFKQFLLENSITFNNFDTLPESFNNWNEIDDIILENDDFQNYVYMFVNDFEGYFPYGDHLQFNSLDDKVLEMMMKHDNYEGTTSGYTDYLYEHNQSEEDVKEKISQIMEYLYDDPVLTPLSYHYFDYFIKYYLEGLLINYQSEIENNIKNGFMTVYRAMTIVEHKLTDLPKNSNADVGICWTYDRDQIQDIISGVVGYGTKEKPLIVLESSIDIKLVDWETTKMLILRSPGIYEEEREIRLFPNTIITITNIFNGDMEPIEKYQKHLPFKIKS